VRHAARTVAAALALAASAAAFLTLDLGSGTSAQAQQGQVILQIAPRGPGEVSASPRGVNESGQPVPDPCSNNANDNSCTARYPAGTRVTLTPKADTSLRAGASFAGWSTPECPGRSGCTLTLDDDDTTVVGTFSPLELRILDFDESKGRITSSPGGIDCGSDRSDCRETFAPGTSVRLTLTPTGGARFTGWGPGCEPTNELTCTIVVSDEPTWAGVGFEGQPPPRPPATIEVSLRVRKSGTGSGRVSSSKIDCGPPPRCRAKYTFKDLVTVAAQEDAGSIFGGWAGVCEDTRKSCTVPAGPITTLPVVFNKDTAAPSVPGALAVKARTRTSITVGWSAASDNAGVTGYRVYLNDAAVKDTTATEHAFEGLKCGRDYALAVDAADAAGNRSARASLMATTSICPLNVRLAGVGVKQKRLVVTLRVSIPTSARLGLWRSGRRMAGGTFRVRPGTNVLRIAIPQRLPAGRYLLKITVSNPEGKALSVSRTVWLPSKR
jgi:hypothetical protein